MVRRALAAADTPPPPCVAHQRRRAFSVAEVDALYRIADHDALDNLLLCILFTSGDSCVRRAWLVSGSCSFVRIGGLQNVPLPSRGPLEEGQTLYTQEKGGRLYPIQGPRTMFRCMAFSCVSLCLCCPDPMVRAPSAYAGSAIRTARVETATRATTHVSLVSSYALPSLVQASGHRGVPRPHPYHRFHGHGCRNAMTSGVCIRHTVAVAMHLAGIRLTDIQAYLGHANQASF